MGYPDFWNKQEQAQKIIAESNELKVWTEPFQEIHQRFEALLELFPEAYELQEEELINDLESDLKSLEDSIDELEVRRMLSGELDKKSCFLTINAGAGGVDAHDWAEMLFRMYTRFLSSQDMKYQIEEISQGEEAGIKSASIRVDSYRAYATLESERGVHRLVRISPFDSNKRRHTSFAGVDVVPLIEHDDEILIQDDEIRIDVYRSSGAGGQHVPRSLYAAPGGAKQAAPDHRGHRAG